MEQILGLLKQLDWMTITAAVVSFVLGLAIFKGKLETAKHVIADVSELVADLSRALADGKVDATEINEIVADAKGVLEAFKG